MMMMTDWCMVQCLCQVSVTGADHLGYPFSFVKEVTVVSSDGRKTVCREEPFVTTVPYQGGGEGGVAIEVMFHGHYGEPMMSLPVNIDSE